MPTTNASLRSSLEDSLSKSPPPFPTPTLGTFQRLVGHWRNPQLAKCFNLWNWDSKIYFKRAVRSGKCVCKRDGGFRFFSKVNPNVVMLCDCETCSASPQPSAVAIYDFKNRELLGLDGATVCSIALYHT